MLKGRGNAQNIVCPIHRWTYDLKGELLGAPHFADKPCLNLGKSPLQNWNGLLFDGQRDVRADLASLGVRDFDFSDHVLDRVEIHECNYNWKTFIEVYLEDYHVEPFHPGLGNFVTCEDLEWQFAPWASLQTVGVTNLRKAGTQDLRALAQGGARLLPRRDAEAGRDLAHLLPEHHARVVPARAGGEHADPARRRHRRPTSSSSTTPRTSPCSSASSSRPSRRRTWRRRSRTTRSPSAWTPAAARCYRAGRSEDGPYQSPMEDGMQHFHEFLRREMEQHIGPKK